MKLDNNDKIVGVKICKDDQDIILSTKLGKCIRFESKKLRIFKGRSSKGIKGIELAPNDQIVSLSIIDNDKTKKNGKKSKKMKNLKLKAKEKFILSITENGYGKKTSQILITELQIEVEKELLELLILQEMEIYHLLFQFLMVMKL